jgi:hypothetical protein
MTDTAVEEVILRQRVRYLSHAERIVIAQWRRRRLLRRA